MGRDWQVLADYLDAEMARHRWSSQMEFASAAGVGLRMIYELLAGHERERMPYKIGRVEYAVGWPPGTARRIVYEGYRPTLDELHPRADVPASADVRLHELAKLRREVVSTDLDADEKIRLLGEIDEAERSVASRLRDQLDAARERSRESQD